MSPWLSFLLFTSPVALLWWISHRRALRHWWRLEEVLDALGDGREPVSYVFYKGGRFSGLTDRLERVTREQERLRRLADDERFNLRAILASMEEGVMVVNSQHVLRLVNLSFLALFGLRGSPLGQSVARTLHHAEFEQLVNEVLRTHEPQSLEVSINGTQPSRSLAVHGVPLRDSRGEQGVLVIFRDVSRLRLLEEVRREFVANVSHELRTPLSIFHGYVETLLETPDLPREDVLNVLGILQKHSLRLNALVEDLLILARLESRHERMVREPVEAEELLRSTATDWAGKAKTKQVAIELDLGPDLPPLVADRFRLEQVFTNLLANAMKYTPAGGRIALRAARVGDALEISVTDSGAGIAAEDLPHIFERFYRADKARSREQGGTGLGLSIVKHIVQAHGGTVRAESTYGSGTAIVLQFPLEAPATHEAEALDHATAAGDDAEISRAS